MDKSSIANFWIPVAGITPVLALTLVLELRSFVEGLRPSFFRGASRRERILSYIFIGVYALAYVYVGSGLVVVEVNALRIMQGVETIHEDRSFAVVNLTAALGLAIIVPLSRAMRLVYVAILTKDEPDEPD